MRYSSLSSFTQSEPAEVVDLKSTHKMLNYFGSGPIFANLIMPSTLTMLFYFEVGQ
jgi:hypothetical protein